MWTRTAVRGHRHTNPCGKSGRCSWDRGSIRAVRSARPGQSSPSMRTRLSCGRKEAWPKETPPRPVLRRPRRWPLLWPVGSRYRGRVSAISRFLPVDSRARSRSAALRRSRFESARSMPRRPSRQSPQPLSESACSARLRPSLGNAKREPQKSEERRSVTGIFKVLNGPSLLKLFQLNQLPVKKATLSGEMSQKWAGQPGASGRALRDVWGSPTETGCC